MADAPGAPPSVRIESQRRGASPTQERIVPFVGHDQPSELHDTAVLLVQVKGDFNGDKPMKLRVVVSAPKEESESGERRAWTVTQTRELHALPRSGAIQVPFLMPYECSSTVKVVATLTGPGIKDSKKLDTAFPCAD